MSESEVFRCCLSLFKLESSLVGQSTIEFTKFSDVVLSTFCSLSASFKTSSNFDQCKVISHIINISSRFIGRCYDKTTDKIDDFNCLIKILTCFESCLSTLWLEEESRSVSQGLILGQNSTLLILLRVISIFNFCNNNELPNTTNANIEELIITSIRTLNILLVVHFFPLNSLVEEEDTAVKESLAKFNSTVRGLLLAQTVQSLLQFSTSKSKTIASLSLQCLLKLLNELSTEDHVSDWRKFFPGIFSSLYSACSSGGISNSTVLHLSLLCIIQATRLVTCHTQQDNMLLMRSLGLMGRINAETVDSSVQTAGMEASKKLLSDLMLRVNKTTNLSTSIETNLTKIPSEFPTVAAFQQWRVDLLQRIEVHLPIVYREAMKYIQPKHKIKVVTSLAILLQSSYQFLGLHCTSEYVLCLISTICDRSPLISGHTRDCWEQLRQNMVNSDSEFYLQLQSKISEKFVVTLHNAVKYAHNLVELKLQYELNTLLGIGFITNKNIDVMDYYSYSFDNEVDEVEKGGGDKKHHSSVVRQLLQLVLPDLMATKTIVLQSRRYYYSSNIGTSSRNISSSSSNNRSKSSTVVEGGYYRLLWKCTNDDNTKSLIRKLFVLVSRHGCLDDIIYLAATATKAISKAHKSSRFNSHHSKKLTQITNGNSTAESLKDVNSTAVQTITVLRHYAGEAMAAFRMLNCALLGQLRLYPTLSDTMDDKKVTVAPPLPECQLCDVTTGLNRCSNCKTVFYCCRDHQLKDWSTHKVICKEAKSVPVSPSPDHVASVVDSSIHRNDEVVEHEKYTAQDIFDPDHLISSQQMKYFTARTCEDEKHEKDEKDEKTRKKTVSPMLRRSVESAIKLCLTVIHQYLHHKALLVSGASMQVEASKNIARQKTSSEMTGYLVELVKYYSHLAAESAECIANCALLMGNESFSPFLIECLFPLLELLVDSDNLVRQAARCSLDRMALYLGYSHLTELIRDNLDYIVEEACVQLRASSDGISQLKRQFIRDKFRVRSYTSLYSGVSSPSTLIPSSTHLIVDFVFGLIGGDRDDSVPVAPLHLMRDMIFDTIENIDVLAATPFSGSGGKGGHNTQLQAMLRVLQVFVYHTVKPPSKTKLINFVNNDDGCDGLRLSHDFLRKIYGSVPSAVDNSFESVPHMKKTKHAHDKNHKLKSLTAEEVDAAAVSDDPADATIYDKIRAIADSSKHLRDEKCDPFSTALADAFDAADREDEAKEKARRSEVDADVDDVNDVEEDDEEELVVEDTAYEATPSQQLLLDILKRCGHFISTPSTAVTVTVIETISAAMLRLTDFTVLLYPALHQIFPPLMSRIQEVVSALYATAVGNDNSDVGRSNKSLGRSNELLLAPRSTSKRSNTLLINEINSTNVRTKGNVLLDTKVYDVSQNLVNSTHSIRTSRDGILTSTGDSINIERLHILPALCEMFSFFAVIANDFLTIKYREELFPQVVKILQFYHHYSVCDSGETSRDSIKLSAISSIATIATTDQVSDIGVRDSQSVYASSRFSMHNKIKLAVVTFLMQMTNIKHAHRYLRSHVSVFIWYLLPMLRSHENAELVEKSIALIQSLCAVDPTVGGTILEAIQFTHPKYAPTRPPVMVRQDNAELNTKASTLTFDEAHVLWNSVISCPEIVNTYQLQSATNKPMTSASNTYLYPKTQQSGSISALKSVPSAEIVLRRHHGDAVFMERLAKLVIETKLD